MNETERRQCIKLLSEAAASAALNVVVPQHARVALVAAEKLVRDLAGRLEVAEDRIFALQGEVLQLQRQRKVD